MAGTPLVAEQIRATVDARPHAACVVTDTELLTYLQVWDRAGELAEQLRRLGVGRGHKVAVLSPNSVDCVVAMVALVRSGAAWLPINNRESRTTIGDVLTRFGCHALLVAPELAGEAGPLSDAVPSLAVAIEIGSRRELLATPVPAADPDDLDLAAVFTTGGTTGVPKGVAFSAPRLAALIRGYYEVLAAPDDVYLAAAPLTHVGGRICLGVLASGGTIAVLPAFEPGAVLTAIERHRVTATTLTSTMLYRLLDHPEIRTRDTSSLRALAFGAGPTALSRIKEALEVFGPVLESGYGQTEAPMLIARLRPDEFVDPAGRPVDDARLASVGRPTSWCDVLVVDDDGHALPASETGEILVRGEFTMSGYYRAPELTQARRCGAYWRTGDVGRFDAEGRLTIVGRKTDLIITGGFNVYPAEVENAAMELAEVAECAVFGVPDPEWGETVALVAVPQPGMVMDIDALRTHLRHRLGGVKTPKLIHLAEGLPRNENGKLLKRLIADRFAADLPPADRCRPSHVTADVEERS
ncbi:AMP-binding protein [Streptomyces sp. NPDC046805]|uniref:class I adenylate-forming enzyme family protein n=1 Tax=Streptomyces sp. NPDC046805 TaxID=3155134 RepID=UPI0033F271D2